jgi:hypothetical protein
LIADQEIRRPWYRQRKLETPREPPSARSGFHSLTHVEFGDSSNGVEIDVRFAAREQSLVGKARSV